MCKTTASFLTIALCLTAADLRLLDAVKRRDSKAVESLVGQRAGLNAAQPDGATALAWAVHLDDAKSVEMLLAAGADVKTADEYGETPLTLACANGNAGLVEKLLKAGASATDTRWNGETALMIAAGAGSPDAVKLLVARGANVNAVEQRKGQNALMWAAAEGHTETVAALIQAGADVKAKSVAGFTALVFAAIKNDAKSVERLIAAGADPNYTLPSGNKVLMVASLNKSVAAVNALVLAGADPNIADGMGNTPLHQAALLGDADLIGNLLKKGAQPNPKTAAAPAVRGGGGGVRRVIGQMTPVQIAANNRFEQAVRVLAASGADPLLKAQEDTTLLMFAAGSGSPGVVEYVFEKLDPRIDAVTANGATAMHFAVTGTAAIATQDEICAVIRYLAAKEARLDEKDNFGRTPLQIATRSSLEKAAALLTELIAKSGR
jgi:ankyrin repeat protein